MSFDGRWNNPRAKFQRITCHVILSCTGAHKFDGCVPDTGPTREPIGRLNHVRTSHMQLMFLISSNPATSASASIRFDQSVYDLRARFKYAYSRRILLYTCTILSWPLCLNGCGNTSFCHCPFALLYVCILYAYTSRLSHNTPLPDERPRIVKTHYRMPCVIQLSCAITTPRLSFCQRADTELHWVNNVINFHCTRVNIKLCKQTTRWQVSTGKCQLVVTPIKSKTEQANLYFWHDPTAQNYASTALEMFNANGFALRVSLRRPTPKILDMFICSLRWRGHAMNEGRVILKIYRNVLKKFRES